MEMPVPCERCGEWFDLHDGYGSRKNRNTPICKDCYDKELEEEESEEE